MMQPTIHANGTPARHLLAGMEGAWEAATALVKALEETAPNGRDYYPQRPGALDTATDEYNDRIARVVSVRNEIEELICAIEGEAHSGNPG